MYVVETCCEAAPEAACTPRGGIGGGVPFETAAADAAAADGPDDVDRPKFGLSAAADLAGWESCCFSGETEGVLGGAWTTSDTAESDPSVPEKERVQLKNTEALTDLISKSHFFTRFGTGIWQVTWVHH